MTIVKHLADYDTSVPNQKSHEGSSNNTSDSQIGKIGKSKSKGANKKVLAHLHLSSSSHVPTQKKYKTLTYFFYQRPCKVNECLQKVALTTLQA